MNIYEAIRDAESKYGFVNRKMISAEYGINDYEFHKNGGLKKLCKEMNVAYRDAHRPDPKEIMDDFLDVYNRFGHINTDLYIQNGKFSKQAVKTAFGSIGELMDSVGINRNILVGAKKEDVLKDVELYIEKTGSTQCAGYRKCGKYSQPVIDRLFGYWTLLLSELGYDSRRKRYGREYIIDSLKSIYAKFGFLSKTLIEENTDFSYQAATNILGGKQGIADAVGDKDAFIRSGSTNEELLFDQLRTIYGNDKVEREATFGWLKNPQTGKHMYMDFVVEEEKVCVEYDGTQHYKWTPFFHRTKEEYEDAKIRDKEKDRLARENGYLLVRFNGDDDLTEDAVRKKIGYQ